MTADTAAPRFDGQAVLVTGAGRGMGKAHAELFAELGAQVVVADAGVGLYGTGSDTRISEEVAATLRAQGHSATSYTGDLASEDGARGAVRQAIEVFGRIDAVVHNAGFTLGAMPMEQESAERLDKQLSINTRAAFLIAQEAWPHFLAAGRGRIVIAGSTAMYGLPRSTPYSVAKASYIGLCRALADEGADRGIHVNLIAPAGATRMAQNMPDSAFRDWFLQQMDPALVSPVAAWLAHPDCTVNGETFVVGGGRVARVVIAEARGEIMPGRGIEDARQAVDAALGSSDAVPLHHFDESMKLMTDALGFNGEQALQFAGGPDDGQRLHGERG